MSPQLQYVDGWFGSGGVESTVIPRPEWPFANNPVFPDVYSRLYKREYLVYPRSFVARMGQRTSWQNLILQSEAFDSASWTKTNATATADAVIAPDGYVTMESILETGATGEHAVEQAFTATAAPWELSVFVKGGLARSWIRLAHTDSAAATRYAFFNFAGGYVGVTSGVTAQIIPLGLGDFRLVIRLTPAAGAGTFKVNLSTDGAAISYAGSTSAGVYLWGAQATLGTDTPYISTTIAARTILAPDRDPVDPLAFLIDEEPPPITTSEVTTFRKTFGRIPHQQVEPDHRYVKKPNLEGTFPQVSGNSLIVQPEANVPRWIFYTHKAVTSDSGAPNASSPTGGTYTVTIGVSTTAAIAYNASAVTLQSALNALPSVSNRGTVTVTGSYTAGFVIRFNAYSPGSLGTGSLTGGGGYTAAATAVTVVNVIDMRFVINALPGSAFFNGGTFTITIFGQTTAPIAYNAVTADVLAAVTALSNVGASGVTVANFGAGNGFSGTNILNITGTQIGFFVQVQVPAVSASGTSLTPSGSAANTSTAAGLFGTNLTLTGIAVPQRVLYSAAHGILSTEGIVLTQGGNYRTLAPGTFGVTTDTIVLTSGSGLAFTDPILITFIGKQTGQTYTAESKMMAIRRVTDFYLVGVTPAINTIDDIPIPVDEGDPASLLAAIFAGDTEINYEVGEQGVWRNGPIVQQARTTLNASKL